MPGIWLYLSQSADARDDSAITEEGCSLLPPSGLSSVGGNQNWDVPVGQGTDVESEEIHIGGTMGPEKGMLLSAAMGHLHREG